MRGLGENVSSRLVDSQLNPETQMTNENTQVQPRRVLRFIGKTLLFGSALVVAILVMAHFAWKYSGSNEWKLEIDRNNVQVYSMKTPGEALKNFKVVTRVKTTLDRAVAATLSTETQDCAAWAPSCRSLQSVQPWNPQDMTYIHLYRMNYPKPLAPREFLLKAQVTQDPQSKAAQVEFIALPDRLPRNECCVRVEHMHNRWRFTPLENGEVEVELRTDMNPGVPYFMMNRMTPRFLHKMFRPLQRWYDKEKWQNARFDLVR
jgi:hypothetical protein